MTAAQVRLARFDEDAALVRALMREYAAFLNASVGGEHICVETLEKELAGLPGQYAEPAGAVLLAFVEGSGPDATTPHPAGCVALKLLHLEDPARAHEHACEMKRLWVRPEFQRLGIGRQLADSVLEAARERGYSAMYLDTMPATMPAAYALYCDLGFVPVARYHRNPVLREPESASVAFLRRDL
ncbi:MAG TPA: GNAT family N-acetyltransferase [Acidobacteriaceae bacterium]